MFCPAVQDGRLIYEQCLAVYAAQGANHLVRSKGHILPLNLRRSPCIHHCRRTAEFSQQGLSITRYERFAAFVEGCCKQSGRQFSSQGTVVVQGGPGRQISSSPAVVGFLGRFHQTKLCFFMWKILRLLQIYNKCNLIDIVLS